MVEQKDREWSTNMNDINYYLFIFPQLLFHLDLLCDRFVFLSLYFLSFLLYLILLYYCTANTDRLINGILWISNCSKILSGFIYFLSFFLVLYYTKEQPHIQVLFIYF